jgi:cellulose synthase/poly-beta-1,6-N-acetylglucosamine synthase-like glycosyltransferase
VAGYKVAANVCMFRRSALRSLPYIYRDGLNFAEDWDLYARLADAGWGNVYSSRVLASYRVWEDSGAVRGKRRAAEIAGITHVFAQTLADAWRRRSWAPDELHVQRRKFAYVQSAAIANVDPASTEGAQLLQLLSELAGDPDFSPERALKRRRVRNLSETLKTQIGDLLKAVLFR